MLLGKRPPWYLYQSFLVLFVFVHDAPNKGTHPPAMHFASWESYPSQDLCEVLSLVATAHGSFSCRFNARPVTEHKYHYCFCLSWPSVRMRRPVRLIGRVAYRFRRRQKEGKECAVLFGCQRTSRGYRESPLTFHAEKLRGLQPSFLIF